MRAGRGGCAWEQCWGLPREPRSPGHALLQASAYLKQNKYQQAEELYKEILSREDLPAPLGEPPVLPLPARWLLSVPTTMSPICSPGAPNTGTAGDAEQQVRMGFASVPRVGKGTRWDVGTE